MRFPEQTTPDSKYNDSAYSATHVGSPRPSARILLSFVVCKLTVNNREYDIAAQRRLGAPRARVAL